RDGNFIQLPGQQLEVGESCSGLRQLIAFTALALLVVHLLRRSWACTILLVASAVPAAIGANLLRVLLMAALLRLGGPAWIGGVYHSLWGLLTMAVGLGLLLGVAWCLARLLPQSPKAETGSLSSFSDLGFRIWDFAGALVCLGLILAGQFGL